MDVSQFEKRKGRFMFQRKFDCSSFYFTIGILLEGFFTSFSSSL